MFATGLILFTVVMPIVVCTVTAIVSEIVTNRQMAREYGKDWNK